MPKILFIQPTQYGFGGKLCKQKRIYLPGLVFPLLAAMTPPNWEVEVLLEVVDDVDFESDADIVGIGTMGYAMWRGVEIADEFRRRGKLVVFGGYMASLVLQDALDHADAVVVGDAEISYPRLLQDYESTGKLQRVYDNPVTDLSGLPVPRYDLLTAKPIGNMLPVQAGRGCPFSCSFCSIACLYRGRYISRPVPEIIRDIKAIRDFGYKRFYLIDDNLVSNEKFLRELALAIAPLGMKWSTQCALMVGDKPELLALLKRSGAEMMSFGIESITQAGLDKLNKSWLRVSEHERLIASIGKAGILVSSEMIIGTDSDTESSIRATYDFIRKTRIPIPRFYILTPIPGSELYEEYRLAGRLVTTEWRRFDVGTCVVEPVGMSAERLTELFWWLYNKVMSLPCILRRTLFHPDAWKAPRAYLFALYVNLHYRRYLKKRVLPNIL